LGAFFFVFFPFSLFLVFSVVSVGVPTSCNIARLSLLENAWDSWIFQALNPDSYNILHMK
jgi:hypothetical protein